MKVFESWLARHRWLFVAPLLSACAIDHRQVEALGSEPASGSDGSEPDGLSPDGGEPGRERPSGAPAAVGSSEVPAGVTTLSAATNRADLGGLEVGTPARFDWVLRAPASGPVNGLALSPAGQEGLAVEDGCGARIEAGAECTIGLTLTPVALGPIEAQVSLSDDSGARVDLTLTARGQARITVEIQGNGRVRSTPAGIDCGDACSALFDPGLIFLRTEPDPGTLFMGMDGASCALPSTSCSVSVEAAQRVTAHFAEPINNLAFISSSASSPALGSVAAYDAECNRLATTAGFNSPTGDGFIAAVSSSEGSFVNRLRPGVRGWVQSDTRPFADTIAGLFAGEMYYPLAYNELRLRDGRRVITGTGGDGSVAENCSDWSDLAGQMVIGDPLEGAGRWLGAFTVSCNQSLPVVCLGNTRTAPLTFEPVSGKRIWRTITPYLPGSMTPDEKCAGEKPAGVAVARALVAYTDRPASSVLDPEANYVRIDGTLVGTGQQIISSSNDGFWEGGFAGGRTIQTGIWQDAAGSYAAGDDLFLVWNGAQNMLEPGAASDSCDNWTAITNMGLAGIFGRAQSQFWARGGPDPCTADAVLYCVEQ